MLSPGGDPLKMITTLAGQSGRAVDSLSLGQGQGAIAGAMIAHHQQAFLPYFPGFSILVFTGAVVGGLGSLLGAFLGSLYWNGTFFWTQGPWRLFASGIGVLIVLLVAPSGIAGLWADLRDLTLRWWGKKHDVGEADLAEDLVP